MLIGVLVSGLVEEYTANITKGVERLAKQEGVNVVLLPGKYINFNQGTDIGNTYGYNYNSIFTLGNLGCFDGLIIEMASVAMYSNDEQKKAFAKEFDKVPHVFISYDNRGYGSVSLDNKAGLMEGLETLYKNGARRFAMLGGPVDNVDAIERKNAFFTFMKFHNLEINESTYFDGDFFFDVSDTARELFKGNDKLDAVICANDFIARTVYKVAREFNYKVGTDLSVLGFDDSTIAAVLNPPLSSVRTDTVELGAEAFRSLMRIINGEKIENIAIPSKFIMRDSYCNYSVFDSDKSLCPDFFDIVKANVHVIDERGILTIRTHFNHLVNLLVNCTEKDSQELVKELNIVLDDIYASDDLGCVDINLAINVFDKMHDKLLLKFTEMEDRKKISITFMFLYKKLIKASNTIYEMNKRNDYLHIFNLQGFIREVMQFTRNFEQNYTHLLENLEFLNIENAYLFLFKEPVSHMQNERFVLPDTILLKAHFTNNHAYSIPLSKQEIDINTCFKNDIVNWEKYNRLCIFPIYTKDYVYGITAIDIARESYSNAELFVNQINSAVKMLDLLEENRKIVNEYEISVRTLKENNIQLDNMSKQDPLTGLSNRRGFMHKISLLKDFCFKNDYLLFVGYADINNLKIINDRFGHDDGDFSIKTISQILSEFLGDDGFAGRIGGDEFAFAMKYTKDQNPEETLEQLYKKFDEFNLTCNKPYNVTVSAGSCLISKDDTITIDEALNIADEKLYKVKEERKKNVIKSDKKPANLNNIIVKYK